MHTESYMSTTSIRIEENVLHQLKLLKKVTPYKSYNEFLAAKLKEELRKYYVRTREGFIPIGTVVADKDGNPLVIMAIQNDKVIFNDETYMLNGSKETYELKVLADTLENYKGNSHE